MFLVRLVKQGADLHLFSGALLIKEWLVILRAINFRTFLYRLTFVNIYSSVYSQTRLQRVSLQCSARQTKFSLINIVLSLKAQRRGRIIKKKSDRTEALVQPGKTSSNDECHSGRSWGSFPQLLKYPQSQWRWNHQSFKSAELHF